jgi:ribosomal protein S18 acetylase RimI-like enzyme
MLEPAQPVEALIGSLEVRWGLCRQVGPTATGSAGGQTTGMAPSPVPPSGRPGISFRAGGRDDVEEVLGLWADAEAEPTSTDDAAGLLELVSHDAGALIVAEDRGRIVGTVIAGWDGWRGSVYRLAVAPTHRREGLGRALVTRAEDRLRALGARRLQAIVVASDARATGFWPSTGWSRQSARLRYVRGGDA